VASVTGSFDLDPGFTTERMERVFSAEARVAAFCRVEAALAMAHADVGTHSLAAAGAVVAACEAPVDDPVEILREGWVAGTPLIPLLAVLRARLEGEAAEALHRGATTQDIVDTATMLAVRDGLAELAGGIHAIVERLAGLAAAHRATPMAGRTFLQQAGTITFGALAAGWLGGFAVRLELLSGLRSRLPLQLAGPLGTGAGLGPHAEAIRAALANRLELVGPTVPWQADRWPVAEVAGAVAGLAAFVATVATDLVLLAQTEVAEVRMRPGGSTSVPGKRNPFDAVHAIATAEACLGCASIITAPRAFELQRAVGGWHAEWFALPMTFRTADAAVTALGDAVATLEVDAGRMRANLVAEPSDEELEGAARLVDAAVAAWVEVSGG
jgi:3-carboxy-cis,cis-muconate cycloisomerase